MRDAPPQGGVRERLSDPEGDRNASIPLAANSPQTLAYDLDFCDHLCDDDAMTMNATTSLRTLADAAYATYYAPIADLDEYLRAELMLHTDEPLTRATLRDAIDNDIHDLLHNANLADLIPDADDLTDDDYDALSRRIDDQRFTAMIARRILDNSYPDMR